jgi:hypothetical protein
VFLAKLATHPDGGLLDDLEEAHRAGRGVTVKWFYDAENDRALDLAEEFKEDLSGLGFAPGELDFLKAPADEEAAPGESDPKEPKPTQDATQVVVVFRDAAETENFLRWLGVSLDSRYVDAPKVFAKHGFKGGV